MAMTELKEVFTKCQESQHTHPQLIKRLNNVYKKLSIDDFLPDFVHCMNYFLVEHRREPAVERGVDFITKFAVSLVAPPPDDEGAEQEPLPEFVFKLFEYLLKHHNASSRGVRFRCCQLVHKLLHNLGHNAQIDDDLYDQIFAAMMTRLRDRFPGIRVQAIQALTRLQDPSDPDCPVIKALMFLMTCDPHPDVRKAALTNIALSKKTLKEVLSRTRDVKEIIRVAAYKIIAEKVHVRALSIAQRVKLLQDGLSDRSDAVRDACGKGLLQSWLGKYGGNVLEVLERLDVEESHETVSKALEELFKHCEPARLVKDFDIINDQCVVPVEALKSENAFYWRSLCQHLRSQGDLCDDLVDKILPTPVNFCSYVRSVLSAGLTADDIDEQLRREFILSQLIQLLASLDLADTSGRNAVEDLVRELLLNDDVSERLVAPLVKLLRLLHVPDEKNHLNSEPGHVTKLVEIIADIRVPVSTMATQPDTSATDAERRKIELNLAGIRVKLNQVRESLNESVENQDFSAAAELKEEIFRLETERESLLLELEEQTNVVEETKIERNDPGVVLKCLKIASEVLYHLKMSKLNPVLRTLMETLIIPGVMTEEASVRKEAVRALGLCAVLDQHTAREHFLLFLQICQVDLENIRLMAMNVVFDVIMTHGLETFENSGNSRTGDGNGRASPENAESESSVKLFESEESEESEEREEEVHTVQSIISILTSWIDSESSDVRTCAGRGLARLLAVGRVNSPRLLSRLMILWYNPLTEDDTSLRHFLGTFFPVFAFDSVTNQELVEESFVLTLRTLLEAPTSSPLSAVNVRNVLDLLIQLCDWRHLAANGNRPTDNMIENNIHNSLAMKLCNELLREESSEWGATLCWALNQLSLQAGELATLQDLLTLSRRIARTMQNRMALRSLERFIKTIQSLINEQPEATPLSQSRQSARSRFQNDQLEMSQPMSDAEPSIDDYTPPDANATNRSEQPSNVNPLPGNDEMFNSNPDSMLSNGGDSLPSNDDPLLGDGVEAGEGSVGSQEDKSAVSESSQSESSDRSERQATRRQTRATRSSSQSSTDGPVRRSRKAREPAKPRAVSTDSEPENSVFATPEPRSDATRSRRSARVAARRSRDSQDSEDSAEAIDGNKLKRKSPTVLSDIENEFV